ncbi:MULTISPECIES: hypothetical protein [Corynebacterium]|uniref:Transposase-like protein n=1 Tax=Corynebacterium segmentosum TaxID=43990 RepID=A0ABY6TC56_9CORY|nr:MULTISPECIES: hypothetical protein [Corynebacterium]EEI15419.1 hypothetical protein HMPREF0276_0034 [Corynebacterium accolens ATCC 49725]UQZ27507.1 hypothetical protein CACC_03950 [Corynebacterium accolens]VEH72444.1 transposase-like protein [Corynebacterium segmentosum]
MHAEIIDELAISTTDANSLVWALLQDSITRELNAEMDAEARQQSGNAVVPLLSAGLGTVLVILALARSGPVFEKKNIKAER